MVKTYSAIPGMIEYRDFVNQCLNNEELFKNFKQNNIYRHVLEHVSKESGVSLEVHHLNKRQHRPYQEFYTKELQDIVYELYKEDFERFGYSYELGK